MALKIDKEILNDAKKEHRDNFGKNPVITDAKIIKEEPNVNTQAPGREEKTEIKTDPPKITNAKTEDSKTENTNSTINQDQSQPSGNEFKEKFEEYFKGMDGLIGGEVIAGIVDDLKANFLFIHAKKNGVDLPKSAFLMDEKTKKFAAFLIDHALKNKLFTVIEKYPILAAVGVIGLSGVSSYLMVEMFKKGNKETEEMKKKTADLEAKLKKYENAETVKDLNEEEKNFVKDAVDEINKK